MTTDRYPSCPSLLTGVTRVIQLVAELHTLSTLTLPHRNADVVNLPQGFDKRR